MSEQFLSAPLVFSLVAGDSSVMQRLRATPGLIDEVRQTAAQIADRQQLTAWAQGPLRELIPHEKAILGFGQIGYAAIQIDQVHAVDIMADYFLTQSDSLQSASPVLAAWMHSRTPQKIVPTNFRRATDSRWRENLLQHEIENGLFDANVDQLTGRMSFIKLFNLERSLQDSEGILVQCVSPLLAGIWKRITTQSKVSIATHTEELDKIESLLSKAERQILPWLRERKTNWEIAQILGKSELTVKTQIQKMLKKTSAVSRHALAANI